MMDFLKQFSDSAAGWASAIAAALVGFAVYLPKINNGMKQDGIHGNVLDRLAALEKKSAQQDNKIHKQAVRITKLVMLVLKLEGIIALNGAKLTQEVIDDIQELTKELELGE